MILITRHKPNERGAVALITTIIISILLGIITTGLIAAMVSELRQEEDSEQANRAYFQAESGVENGISQVLTAVKNGGPYTNSPGCNSNTSFLPSTDQVGYTCQLITYAGTPQGSLDKPDTPVQIDTGNATYSSLKLQWSSATGDSSCALTSSAASWRSACAPPLELAIVQYPRGSFAAGTGDPDLILKNAVLAPNTVNQTPNFGSLRANNPYTANCSKTRVGYKCFVNINGFNASDSYLFRLRSRFVGTDYKMTFYTGSNATGSVVNVPDGSATIDVTAKSGNSYRRVLYKVPYEHGAATGLDYVIYSDTNICKDFDVVSNAPENDTCP